MRIATIQFNPQVGEVEQNMARADELLASAGVTTKGQCDLLVLPEMAFSGYNFPSLNAINPYLEPTAAGPSSLWAKRTAARLGCIVSVGYPEIADLPLSTNHSDGRPPSSTADRPVLNEENLPTNLHPDQETAGVPKEHKQNKRYNATVTVDALGNILAHYRKTHLYETDESWASESPEKFLTVDLRLSSSLSEPGAASTMSSGPPTVNGSSLQSLDHTGEQSIRTTFGICMDLNPHLFTASWDLYELAIHTLHNSSALLCVSMAWCTHEPSGLPLDPTELHTDSLSYWTARVKPLVDDPTKQTIVAFANRCGKEGDVCYVGSSWVGVVGKGEVKIWGMLGYGEEAVLQVDTAEEPTWRLFRG